MWHEFSNERRRRRVSYICHGIVSRLDDIWVPNIDCPNVECCFLIGHEIVSFNDYILYNGKQWQIVMGLPLGFPKYCHLGSSTYLTLTWQDKFQIDKCIQQYLLTKEG